MSYGVTSLPPARLLELVRGHWAIENRVHYVRDRTFDEDRSQVRMRGAPQLMATPRNLAISLPRLARASNIVAALRHFGRHVRTTLRLIGLEPARAARRRPPCAGPGHAQLLLGARIVT